MMRQVDRRKIDPPSVLDRKNRSGSTELQRAEKHFEADPIPKKKFPFVVYRDREVKAALELLFHGKCAYCESRYWAVMTMDTEHYRPKRAVEGQNHPGYWWLASDWENLLPSCALCNRRQYQEVQATDDFGLLKLLSGKKIYCGKGKVFPMDLNSTHIFGPGKNVSEETPLLLDPTRDDPTEHLDFYISPLDFTSLVIPKQVGRYECLDLDLSVDAENFDSIAVAAQSVGLSRRGTMSIHVYGLNRLSLVHERKSLITRLEYLLTVIEDMMVLKMEMDAHLDSEVAILADQLESNRLIEQCSVQFSFHISEMIDQIRYASLPDAPYSELVNNWIGKRLDVMI